MWQICTTRNQKMYAHWGRGRANSGFTAAARKGNIAPGGMNLEKKVRTVQSITAVCHASITFPRKAVNVIQGSTFPGTSRAEQIVIKHIQKI